MIELSENEWFGDLQTHLTKSGSAMRKAFRPEVVELSTYIPRKIRDVPVEYDITYESPKDTIRGYKMTDFLATCLWIAPCSTNLTTSRFCDLMERGPTDEGHHVLEKVFAERTDKYQMAYRGKRHIKNLIVLPGSNLLSKRFVCVDKVDYLVNEEGALIKPHPITNRLDMHLLRDKFGDSVLSKDELLYPLVDGAEKINFCMSSEVGFSAVFGKKTFTILDNEEAKNANHVTGTYESFYRALLASKAPYSFKDRLASLFSYPESGVVSIFHERPQERIKAFVESWSATVHRRT